MKNIQLMTLNKVMYNGEIKTVDSLCRSAVTFVEDCPSDDKYGKWIDFDLIDFVPLTEEFLISKAFTKDQFGNINITSECVIQNGFEYIGFYSDYHEDDITFKLPKYVHDLQNLYYAVTKQSLIL